MLQKWKDFLEDNDMLILDENMPEDDSDEQYDLLVRLFCTKYGYTEKTKEIAFYDKWYDTFADEYFKKFEEAGIEIKHGEKL
jgi:hypothetical protein